MPRCFRPNCRLTDLATIGQTFGAGFAEALEGWQPGQWVGPVPSGYGLHVVRVPDRKAGRLPALGRGQGRGCARLEQREAQGPREARLMLLARYKVMIETGARAGRRPMSRIASCSWFLILALRPRRPRPTRCAPPISTSGRRHRRVRRPLEGPGHGRLAARPLCPTSGNLRAEGRTGRLDRGECLSRALDGDLRRRPQGPGDR